MVRIALLVLAAAAALAFPGFAAADTLVLQNGATLDGKVVKEDGEFLWVKTLLRIEKVAAGDVKSRTPGESNVEKYEKLRAAAEKEPVQVAALWELCVFQKAHMAELPPGTDRENARLLQKILKRDPEHEGAHGEIGDVRFGGRWVKAADLPRLEAEKAQAKLLYDWQMRLNVPVKIVESEHFRLVDNTGDQDLAGRSKTLEKAYEALVKALGVEALWKDRANIITIKGYEDYLRVLADFAAEAGISEGIVTAAKDPKTGGLWRNRPSTFQIRWPSSGVENMWSAIVHNVSHMSMWSLWGKDPPPAWIDEGMGAWVEIEVMGQQVNSCMGESAKPKQPKTGGTSDKDPRKKKDPKKNAEDLAASRNEYKERCKQALEADEFPPMRQFLKYRVGDIGPPEEGGVLGLVTWLMRTDAEKFRKLFKLFRAGGRRTDDEYWREAYGFELIEDMETKWRAWALAEW